MGSPFVLDGVVKIDILSVSKNAAAQRRTQTEAQRSGFGLERRSKGAGG